MARIVFADIQAYLDAIATAGSVQNGTDINASPHKRFWTDYNTFMNVPILKVACAGQTFTAVDQTNKPNSPFFQSLINPAGFCNNPQMPFLGPFLTDTGYSVTLANGTVLSGTDISTNIKSWLDNGCPEV